MMKLVRPLVLMTAMAAIAGGTVSSAQDKSKATTKDDKKKDDKKKLGTIEIYKGKEGFRPLITVVPTGDASTADWKAGMRYSYDFNDDGVWDLGDGATYAGSVTTASLKVPAAFLQDSGPIAVRVRVFDKDGGYVDKTATIDMENQAPTATFSMAGGVAYVGKQMTFQFTNPVDSPLDKQAGIAVIRGAVEAVVARGHGVCARVQQAAYLVALPHVEFSFLVFRIRIERGVQAAARRRHLASGNLLKNQQISRRKRSSSGILCNPRSSQGARPPWRKGD